jgi:hypothetical protein
MAKSTCTTVRSRGWQIGCGVSDRPRVALPEATAEALTQKKPKLVAIEIRPGWLKEVLRHGLRYRIAIRG